MKIKIWLGVLLVAAPLLLATDNDSDGLDDLFDGCTNDNEGSAANRCDRDADGYGNRCDGDFNQDGAVLSGDYSMFFVPDLNTSTDSGRGTDMNCDGSVLAGDYSMFFVPQLMAAVPGPSGIDCRGKPWCRKNVEAKIAQLTETSPSTYFDWASEPTHPTTCSTDPDDSETPSGYLYGAAQSESWSISTSWQLDSLSGIVPWTANFCAIKGGTNSSAGTMYAMRRTITGRTQCNRTYFEYSSGFADVVNNNPTGVVLASAYTNGGTTNDPGIYFAWSGGGATLQLKTGIQSTPFGTNDANFSGNTVPRSSCAGEICYFEYCLDHSVGGDNKLRVRGEIRVVTGTNAGDTDTVSVTLPNAVSTAHSGDRNSYIDMTGEAFIIGFAGQPLGSWFTASEFVRAWNSASLIWATVDNTKTIGPAYEVEGY